MSDTPRSVLPYRDGAERAAEVRSRRLKILIICGVAIILVLAIAAAFAGYRRGVMAEREARMMQERAIVAQMQQQLIAQAAATRPATQQTVETGEAR